MPRDRLGNPGRAIDGRDDCDVVASPHSTAWSNKTLEGFPFKSCRWFRRLACKPLVVQFVMTFEIMIMQMIARGDLGRSDADGPPVLIYRLTDVSRSNRDFMSWKDIFCELYRWLLGQLQRFAFCKFPQSHDAVIVWMKMDPGCLVSVTGQDVSY